MKVIIDAVIFIKDGAYYCYCAYVLRISSELSERALARARSRL